jgi:IS5 family transposase
MHQTKKGNQWYFGMKAHIGVDAESGLVHTVISTAANTHDISAGWDLLHGQEQAAHGDAGYRGIEQREEALSYYEAHERDPQQDALRWQIAMRPGKRKALKAAAGTVATQHWAKLLDEAEQIKASIRAKVEHPFHIVKNLFKYKKVSYRGLAKNAARHVMLFALANLVIVKRKLMQSRPQSVCSALRGAS